MDSKHAPASAPAPAPPINASMNGTGAGLPPIAPISVKSPPSTGSGTMANAIAPQTIVLKIGSSSVTDAVTGSVKLSGLAKLCETIVALMQGPVPHNVVLVTSGAVSVGCQRMGLAERPTKLVTKLAVAAIGQGRLMRVYDDLFAQLQQPIAQVLLSRDNLGKAHHYTNAKNTFAELMRLRVLAVVNENDTVAVEELRFGDNDTLSALVASLISADWHIILTDIDAVYTANPSTNPDAKKIECIPNVHEWSIQQGQKAAVEPEQSGKWGTGGMATKIAAAQIATCAGVRSVIMSSARVGDIIPMINAYTPLTQPGTVPEPKPIAPSTASGAGAGAAHASPAASPATSPLGAAMSASAAALAAVSALAPLAFPYGTLCLPLPKTVTVKKTKRWIAHGLPVTGKLYIDPGAVEHVALKKSLFAAGIRKVEGTFMSPANVALYLMPPATSSSSSSGAGADAKSPNGANATFTKFNIECGVELARGLCNYSSEQMKKILGKSSSKFEELLGYPGPDAVINREQLALTHPALVAHYAALWSSSRGAAAAAAAAATAAAPTPVALPSAVPAN